ncbi:hypothetical protein LTR81_019747 [Elasticomyces elasticus]
MEDHLVTAGWKFAATAIDRFTKHIDAKHPPNQGVQIQHNEIPFPSTEPKTGANGPQLSLNLTTNQLTQGPQYYHTPQYNHLAALPMFLLDHTNDEKLNQQRLESAAQHRSHVRDVELTPIQRAVMTLSGGGAMMTGVKFENGLNKLNAQLNERATRQQHVVVLTRWTVPVSEVGVVNGVPLLVDTLEIKANRDVRLRVDGKKEGKAKKGSTWTTAGGVGCGFAGGVTMTMDDGSEVRLAVVARTARLISQAEVQGTLGTRGVQKRFQKEWVVPEY